MGLVWFSDPAAIDREMPLKSRCSVAIDNLKVFEPQ